MRLNHSVRGDENADHLVHNNRNLSHNFSHPRLQTWRIN